MNTVKWLAIAVLLLIAGFLAVNAFIYEEKQADEETAAEQENNELPGLEDESEEASSQATYFQNELFARATAKTGAIPIEGYGPQLLMGPFPGFIPSDFEGVAAFEGVYSTEEGEIIFTRNTPQPVSSAERTISSGGYQTLLENVTDRLNVTAETEVEIDTLITLLEE